MNKKLQRFILLALLKCDGMPMPESALVGAAQSLAMPERPTRSDVESALKDVEAAGYVSGVSDDIAGVTWTLTDKGTHQARKLR